jgi:hypothetical protein
MQRWSVKSKKIAACYSANREHDSLLELPQAAIFFIYQQICPVKLWSNK